MVVNARGKDKAMGGGGRPRQASGTGNKGFARGGEDGRRERGKEGTELKLGSKDKNFTWKRGGGGERWKVGEMGKLGVEG